MQPEEIEQCKLFDWIRTVPELDNCAFHIANERKTNPMRGLLLKRMGVLSGVSDVFIALPKEGFHGLFLELKAGNNKATNHQKLFMDRMNQNGYLAICCIGYEAAKAIILTYLQRPCAEFSDHPLGQDDLVFRCA